MSKISLIFGLAVYGFRASTIRSIEVLAETFFEMTFDWVNICSGDAINENLEVVNSDEVGKSKNPKPRGNNPNPIKSNPTRTLPETDIRILGIYPIKT